MTSAASGEGPHPRPVFADVINVSALFVLPSEPEAAEPTTEDVDSAFGAVFGTERFPAIPGAAAAAPLEASVPFAEVLAGSRARPPSVAAVMWMVTGVADRLVAYHASTGPHRRLAPSTVSLAATGVVTLSTDAQIGSAEWMFVAPEVRMGRVPDGAADLFALGLLGVSLLAGEPIVEPTPTRLRFLERLIGGEHGDAADVVRGLFALLGQLVDPDPSRRPADARTVAVSLRFVFDTLGGWPERARELAGLVAGAGAAIPVVLGGRPASTPAVDRVVPLIATCAQDSEEQPTIDGDTARDALTSAAGIASQAPPPRDASMFTFQGGPIGSTPLVLRGAPLSCEDKTIEHEIAALGDVWATQSVVAVLPPIRELDLMAPPSIPPARERDDDEETVRDSPKSWLRRWRGPIGMTAAFVIGFGCALFLS